MATYREQIISLLRSDPELADDPQGIADRIGCCKDTASRYIKSWYSTRNITWVLEPITTTTVCSECSHRVECELLTEMRLVPMHCERVAEGDLVLAALNGLELEVLEGRAWVSR